MAERVVSKSTRRAEAGSIVERGRASMQPSGLPNGGGIVLILTLATPPLVCYAKERHLWKLEKTERRDIPALTILKDLTLN